MTCLIDTFDGIYDDMEHGVVCGDLLLDLKKAFDRINHSILLEKINRLWVEC